MKKKTNDRGKKRPSSVILIIAIIVAGAVFCFAGYNLLKIWLRYHAAETSYDTIHDLVLEETGDNSFASPSSDAPDFEETLKVISNTTASSRTDGLKVEYEDEYDEGMVYNYEALLNVNPDAIGYIKARGDGGIVDYPIVQGADNDYYLTHMFDKTENAAGCVFMDSSCTLRFSAPYCILYGHNMASGSRMFGYLKQYENPDYYKSHTEYDVYTPYNHFVYKICAIYITYPDQLTYETPLLYNTEYLTDEDKSAAIKEFAAYALSMSDYDTGYTADDFNEQSHIIALSTCYGSYSDPHRYIILLVRDRIVLPREATNETSAQTETTAPAY